MGKFNSSKPVLLKYSKYNIYKNEVRTKDFTEYKSGWKSIVEELSVCFGTFPFRWATEGWPNSIERNDSWHDFQKTLIIPTEIDTVAVCMLSFLHSFSDFILFFSLYMSFWWRKVVSLSKFSWTFSFENTWCFRKIKKVKVLKICIRTRFSAVFVLFCKPKFWQWCCNVSHGFSLFMSN